MKVEQWEAYNPQGSRRVVVTRRLPGQRWLDILTTASCRVDLCTSKGTLEPRAIESAIGNRCDGAIGQLTETWGEPLFQALKSAGGRVYSNYAVGFNNVDVRGATRHGIAVGNTPGVLTETTAELAVALTLVAARRVVEADAFMRSGRYEGWLPDLFLGALLSRKTVGVIGAGQIGSAYARMMVEAFRMDLVYYDPSPNRPLEEYVTAYAGWLASRSEPPVTCTRADNVEQVLRTADVVSLHTVLDGRTVHLLDAGRLGMMKPDAVLVNASRGPVIDEAALVVHCRAHPEFKVGLDVFEDEPLMQPGLAALPNAVVLPHIGSATVWTRQAMAVLAACNVAGILMGFPLWQECDMGPFMGKEPPPAVPSIVNAKELGLAAG